MRRSRKPWMAGQETELSAQLLSLSGSPVCTRRIQAPLLASHYGGGYERLDANQVVWLGSGCDRCGVVGFCPGVQTAVERTPSIDEHKHITATATTLTQTASACDASAPKNALSVLCVLLPALFRYECLYRQPGRQPCGGWGLVQLAGGYHEWRRGMAGFQLMGREVRAAMSIREVSIRLVSIAGSDYLRYQYRCLRL
ncbi:hypothetical protein N5P37_007137 [Trichoderma harzianum]|nr:hypothetical protein N5P37_007137 [Trichoderma harzianum]